MAENLFAAISTDTGSFQYSQTTDRTYEIAAELIRKGVRVSDISQRLYESYPKRRIELLKSVLNELRFSSEDRVASFTLTRSAAEELGAIPDDTEGLIDTIRAVEGVIIAIFFEELSDGRVRVSLRSKDARADVCRIASAFGGGGHTMAAGIRMTGPMDTARARVLDAVDSVIRGL
jgi:phosphoesterase RecJ-like protein